MSEESKSFIHKKLETENVDSFAWKITKMTI